MNCPQCGHPQKEHIDGCYHRIISDKKGGWFYCGCTAVEADTEEQILEKRLALARELIAVLSHNGMMPENMMTDGGAAWRKWQAEEGKP